MSPYPQAGELWCAKQNPSLMVLVIRIAECNQLVLTKSLFDVGFEGWRGLGTFRNAWKPVA